MEKKKMSKAEAGRLGGKKSNPNKGFGSDPIRAKELGRLGYLKMVENLKKKHRKEEA